MQIKYLKELRIKVQKSDDGFKLNKNIFKHFKNGVAIIRKWLKIDLLFTKQWEAFILKRDLGDDIKQFTFSN